MNFPTQKNVNVAVSKRNKFDLTKQVVTTHDFGRMKAIEMRYMVPGDKFNVKVSSFTRLLPMSAPTFGRIDCIQRGFFVPMRTIFPHFYDFIRNRPVQSIDSTNVQQCPHALMGSIQNVFLANAEFIHDFTSTAPEEGEYDFSIDSDRGDYGEGYYKLTAKGRRLYDFVTSMGLNINFDSSVVNVSVNILPLVAFWKAYYDWIVPSRFIQSDEGNIYRFLNQYSDFNWNAPADESELATYLIKIPYSFYKDDFFTSAWKNPLNPDDTVASETAIPNPAMANSNRFMNGVSDGELNSGYPVGARVDTNADYYNANYYINQFTVESLGKLQDYLNRGMLAGSKIQDWLATEFGIRPNSDAIGLSTYLGKMQDTIKIGDITSNADTEASGGVALGAYAGIAKGASVGNFAFEAKGEDHGYFFITTELIPKTSYYQGLSPEFYMTDRLDFFQPEFDNMGVDAVSMEELFFSPRKIVGSASVDVGKIFGYVPRYSKLKTAFDVVSGDFRNRFGAYLKPWYLARDVEKWLYYNQQQGTDFINEEFCKVLSDYQNWDYIFNDTNTDLDHFYQIFLIENNAMRPMLSVSEALDPEHPNGNKTVNINTNGGIE